ncbi:hypothetical protein STSP2_02158 [Anaerohalosphaera lusitana]|uniref:DUF2007 domain-containing protein n=1 Tax=Anaerohalosphaera lusitana TaxID=1936003 RepID=A0A1U9NMZ9_9BACT|nr:DUF2007 domain-containing protein [Anaerohalosphaera lusitana]AQT68980.1 hypothetical protein STSP2_02158 [Anaerohalosphaera lusitana]
MSSDKLITIAEYENNLDARLAMMWLESNGVKATVTGETLSVVVPEIGWRRIELQVLESDAEEARKLLEEHEKQRDDEIDGDE